MHRGRLVVGFDGDANRLRTAQKQPRTLPRGYIGKRSRTLRGDLRALCGHIIALRNALPPLIEGLFHHAELPHTTILLLHRAAESRQGRTTVDPTHTRTAKALLKQLAQVAREDIAFDERVAEIGNAHRPVELFHLAELGIERIHAARLAGREIGNRLHAFGPHLLKCHRLALLILRHNGPGHLGCRHHIRLLAHALGQQLAQDVHMAQRRSANAQRRQLVHQQQPSSHQSR